MASMVLAGCVSPEMQSWGPDGIEVTVNESEGTATMSTHTGDYDIENKVGNLLGCDSDGIYSAAPASTDKPIRIEGWLHQTKHFPDAGSAALGEKVSTSAVIIQLGEYDEVTPPTLGKVDQVKQWNSPFSGVKAIPPGFTSGADFPHDGWAIVGLVPANENILEGFGGLDWHQKISLEGWLIADPTFGHRDVLVSDDGQCRIYAVNVTFDGFRGAMVVTSMTLGEHGLIDEENSYNSYSVPIIGSWLYSLSLLGSIAGAVLLFFLASGLIRRGAKLSARELMTEAQMLAAKTVKKEVRHDMHRVKSETGQKKKIRTAKADIVKAEKFSEKPSIELDDFDVESVMREGNRPSAHSVRSSSSSGVIETEESVDLQEKMDEAESLRELQDTIKERQKARLGGKIELTEGLPDKPDTGMAMSRSDTAKAKPEARKVRKTKAVKKKPEPEPKPVVQTNTGPDIADDEDFSDFAL
jgi:hypothetical protein